MRFFLDAFVGDGSEDTVDAEGNPFRPAHADGAFSINDLRGVWTVPDGVCLVGAEALVGTPIIDFGDTLDGGDLPMPVRRAFANRLGVSFDQVTLRGIITELMILHGREDGSRWRNVKQNTFGNHKVSLGGQVVYDAPIIQGTTLQDTFVETTDTNLADHTATGPDSGYGWTQLAGGASGYVVKEAIDELEAGSSQSNTRARADSDLASDDHFAQCSVTNWANSITLNCGPMVRVNSSADSFYVMLNRDRADNQYRLFKVTTGSFSLLTSVSEALPTEPATPYLEIDGSDLEGFMDAVSKIGPQTDTSFTGQVRCGLLGGDVSSQDLFKAEDLGAAPAVPVVRRRQLTTVRM